MDAYVEQVNDYAKQGHSEKVPPEEMLKPTEQTYYLPMHGVSKLSSSTTKLWVVCDVSAKTAGSPSLNILGTSLYPRLTTVLLKFRLYDVAYSADISRMFRKVTLYPEDHFSASATSQGVPALEAVSMTSPLISLNLILDDDNIIRITGLLRNTNMPHTSKQPILLAKNSQLTTLLLLDTHTLHKHPGARTMMSILSETYYVAGL